jgi:hypothetical protein
MHTFSVRYQLARLRRSKRLHSSKRFEYIPSIGDRLERRGLGLTLRCTVLYADRVRVFVKWDDGRVSSLRAGADDLDLIDAEVSSV